MTEYDLLIIGGGINGVGIARDAAGRGLKVLLVEKGDLTAATSSKSTKLIHGGLRYLEFFEFRLVRKSLIERALLRGNAPHIITPLRFILPHETHLRPKWLIRLGLFLYDHLGGRSARNGALGKSRRIALDGADPGNPLRPRFTDAFTYYDCRVDDARLVIVNAVDARDQGADILTRTRFVAARPWGERWQADIADDNGGERRQVTARAIVNAAGPWVTEIMEQNLGLPVRRRLRRVKGSHIIVPRLFPGDDAYILQNKDGRIIFAIPYEAAFTLIGTTETPFNGDPAAAAITPAEVDYLCGNINHYFKPTLPHGAALSASDVLFSYAGVRALLEDADKDARAVTRDYELDLRTTGSHPPLLTVLGGKITTYRRLAEDALEKLGPVFPEMADPWTAAAPLPGGDIARGDLTRFIAHKQAQHPDLDPALCQRYAHNYGTRMDRMLDSSGRRGPARMIGPGLYDYEAEFLIRQEWAVTAEDILWRRTKLGLTWTPENVARLESWLARRR